ncbi:hypothetical protein AVEN_124225-1 [Araneus ventricosus]|uniref:Uncharacterized protein n=1 Tax=Araneus ventricosus TaxID=182803 RepID=A0A4Y2WG72_ARAVE|nr:hypothetical protein AVEN_124225-1 [Araneus ventricosus]
MQPGLVISHTGDLQTGFSHDFIIVLPAERELYKQRERSQTIREPVSFSALLIVFPKSVICDSLVVGKWNSGKEESALFLLLSVRMNMKRVSVCS